MASTAQLLADSLSAEKEYLRRKEELINSLKRGDYHLSPSSLRAFAKSPKHFLKYKLEAPVETDAFRLGHLLECVVFDRDEILKDKFIIIDLEKRPDPGKTFAAKANKAWLAKMKNWAKSEKKRFATKEEISQARIVRENIFADPIASTIFHSITELQKEIKWQRCGVNLLGYIDGIGENILLEFKDTYDADYTRFQWECRKYGYDIQVAMYADATGVEEVYLVAADWDGNVTTIRYSEDTLNENIYQYQEYIERFKECVENDWFEQGYSFHKKIIWR